MLYTILSLDDVFPPASEPAPEEIRVGNCLFEGRRDGQNFLISRMISTNPADYLDERYSPGKRL